MEAAIDIEITVNVSNSQPHLRDDLWEGNRSSSIVDDVDDDIFDSSSFNAETLVTVITLTVITIVTIVGNVLVILSVFTYKPLRIVQNFFIVSLAVADLTVAILVMPLNIVYNILGKWVFGLVICEMWLTCDVLCCTASILNLCAIALDRYRAITDPLNYAQKRTFKRVMLMIVLVWAISGIICLPPLIGWNDWPDDFDESYECRLTEEKGYVIYSSCGSFYIPLLIMTLVYIKIFMATRRRLRERARASKISVAQNLSKPPRPLERTSSFTPSEANHNEDTCANVNHKQANGKEQRTPKTPRTNPKEDNNENTQPTTNDLSNNKKQKKNSSRKKDKTAGDKDGSLRGMTTAEASASIPQFIEERQKISLTRERRAARTLGIIMGVFVVCWLPFFLMYVIIPFCEKACPISDSMINFITWLGYINSCLNPVIYTIFNIDFRRAFAKLLKCK